MAGNRDGNIFGVKPVIGSKNDNVSGNTAISLLKKLVNKMGLGSYDYGFNAGFELFRDDTADQIHAIYNHLHNQEWWFGDAAVAISGTHEADLMDGAISAFQLISGNSAFGSWLQVLGSNDTPVKTGMTKFDPHSFLVTGSSFAGTYVFQFVVGEEYELPIKLANKDYGMGVYTAATTANDANIQQVMSSRIPAGSKMWARVACVGQNAKTINFYFGIHEYVY